MPLSTEVDLHIHSTFSDGEFTPAELVDLAESQGLAAIAITDHDTAAGTAAALKRAEGKRIEVIPGIEISAWHGDTSMHILGYCFNPGDSCFSERLKLLQEGRETRNARILAKLNRLGIGVAAEELQQYSRYGQTGRPHIARLLVDRGVTDSVELAFKHYLRRGAAAYSERFRFSAHDAISMIREAGGTAVLAHPANLDSSLRTIPFLLRDLNRSGLAGVEVYYPSHTAKTVKALLQMAAGLNLCITGGSDFHGLDRETAKTEQWLEKTHIPYDIVLQLKQQHCGEKIFLRKRGKRG